MRLLGWTLWCVLGIPGNLPGASQPPPGFQLTHTEDSGTGAFLAEHYYCESNWLRQIWIARRDSPTNRTFLFGHQRSATVRFSPDDRWLVVNDYLGSDTAEPILYRQKKGTLFERAKQIDLSEIIWKAAAADQRFAYSMDFDHRYSQADCWLGTNTILLHAWGHHSGEHWLEDWHCLYDLKTGKVHYDLTRGNRGAFQKVRKPAPAGKKPKPAAR